MLKAIKLLIVSFWYSLVLRCMLLFCVCARVYVFFYANFDDIAFSGVVTERLPEQIIYKGQESRATACND